MMTISVWQYNQVIDGLRMQLQLQRKMTQEKNAELERVYKLNSDQAAQLFTQGETIQALRKQVREMEEQTANSR